MESALIEHSCVLEAAVIAFEDERGLHTPKAFVVLREDYAGSAELVKEASMPPIWIGMMGSILN